MAVGVRSQRHFAKGLITVVQSFSQPEGSVSAMSNLHGLRRDALQTPQGSALTANPASGFAAGPILALSLFAASMSNIYEVALQADQSAAPTLTRLIQAVTNYGAANVLSTAFPVPPISNGAIVTSGGRTPSGGMANETCALPLILQYNNSLMLLLGNGVAPYAYPNGGPAAALANNFSTSAFPSWTALTAYQQGSIIIPATPNGHLYTCVQAGTSGASAPAFPTGASATVSDLTAIWQESGSSSIVAPRGAAHGNVFAGFLWLYNTSPTTTADLLDGPGALKMSDLNNPNSWNPLNTAHLDLNDGQEGTGIVGFAVSEAGIAPAPIQVCFKNFKTFIVNDIFGSPNFDIYRARTDMGCIAPRSIQFVAGHGIFRLTHKGVAVFNGIRDVVISGGIYDQLFVGTIPTYATSMQVATPPLYVLAVPTGTGNGLRRLFIYDLDTREWTELDLPFDALPMREILYPNTTANFSAYHIGGLDANVRQLEIFNNASSFAWDTGSAGSWSFSTPEVVPRTPSDRNYFRRLYVRGFASQGLTTLSVVVVIDNASLAAVAPIMRFTGSGRFEGEIPIGKTGLTAHANISGAGPAEIDSVEWNVTPKPSGVPVTLLQ